MSDDGQVSSPAHCLPGTAAQGAAAPASGVAAATSASHDPAPGTRPFPDPIPGVLPFGTLTVMAGAAGVGKTAMLAEWIQRWRTGRPIWGHPSHPPTAFCYIAADRQWASHQLWFDAVGYPEIPRYSLADDPTFDLNSLTNPKTALDLLPRALDRAFNGQPCPAGAHVFIDPVSPLFIVGNPNSQRDVARTMIGMSRECQQRQINLTVTAHFAKQPANSADRYQRPQDRIAGSNAFAGFSDTQIYMLDPEPAAQQPWHILGWVPRHAKPEEFTCRRNDHGLFVPYDMLVEDTTAHYLFDILCASDDEYMRLEDVADQALKLHTYSKATVKRGLARLITQGRAAKVGRGKYVARRLN